MSPEPNGRSGIGIGHNNPPGDVPITQQDYSQIKDVLDQLQTELPLPASHDTKAAGQRSRLAQACQAILVWLARKGDKFVDSFAEALGEETAKALASGAKWIGLAYVLAEILKLWPTH